MYIVRVCTYVYEADLYQVGSHQSYSHTLTRLPSKLQLYLTLMTFKIRSDHRSTFGKKHISFTHTDAR